MSERQIGPLTVPTGIPDRYRIVGVIGSGGMGTVYRADDALLRRPVAIKVLSEPRQGGSARPQLLGEARAASALNHPNICTVFEVGRQNGQPFIVMEYVEGDPLSTRIPPGEGLPLQAVLAYGSQIAQALAHAHGRGVVHRDLKSANIVITPEHRVKVLDFGLAMRLPRETLDVDTSTLNEASPETDKGTPGTLLYMAPEILHGVRADHRADIWALGVILYEMVAGERPFRGQTPFELSAAILSEPMRPLPSRVPESLRAVVGRCLTRDPAIRYQSASEVHAVLEALQLQETVPRRSVHWLRRGMSALGLGALVLTIVMVALTTRNLMGPTTARATVKLAVIPQVADGTPFDIEASTENIVESVIDDITRVAVPDLQVIALSTALQFKNTRGDLLEIVRQETGATFVVTIKASQQEELLVVNWGLDDAGSKSRISGDRILRTVAKSTFTIEQDIATTIANRICELTQSTLTDAGLRAISRRKATNEEALLLYSKGRIYWYTPTSTAETYLKSLELYRQALDKDSNFALAYLGIADTYLSLAWEGWIRQRGTTRITKSFRPRDGGRSVARREPLYEGRPALVVRGLGGTRARVPG